MKRLFNILIICSSCSLLSGQDGLILNAPYINQIESQWCWAGVSNSIIEYYGTDVDLCDIAEFARSRNPSLFGTDDCCDNPTPTDCNNPNSMYNNDGGITEILRHWDIYSDSIFDGLTYSESQTQIDAGRPFVIRWAGKPIGGHFLVGRGYIDNSIYYIDPNDGYHLATHSWIDNNTNWYWSHTLSLTTNPSCVDATAVFSDPITSDIVFDETNRIIISSAISNNSDVELTFGTQIIIDSGFEISQGSTLIVEPDSSIPCD